MRFYRSQAFQYGSLLVLFALLLWWFDISLLHVIALSIAAFWLAVLPGVLLVQRFLDYSPRKSETWFVGSALGITILPVLFTLSSLLTTDAPTLWWIAGSVISLLNIALLLKRTSLREQRPSIVIPWRALAILTLVFLIVFQFQQLGRTAHGEKYFYSVYYGGDIPNLVAFLKRFLISSKLIDYHTNGATVYHHDFLVRLLAGIHFFVGGDPYDTEWFWLEPMGFLLLFGLLWLYIKKITQSNIAAWLGIGFFLLADNYNKDEVFFTMISDTYRFGLIIALLAMLLLFESYRTTSKTAQRNALALLCFVLAIGIRWKATFFMVLVPSLLLVEFVHGVRDKEWKRFAVIAVAAVIAAAQALIIFGPAVSIAGETVIGRPLYLIARLLTLVSAGHLRLSPVSPISELTGWRMLSMLIALPLFFLACLLLCTRYALLVVFVKRRTNLDVMPYAELFLPVVALVGLLVRIVQSPKHYNYGDSYQAFFGLVLALPAITMVVERAWKTYREKGISARTQRASLLILALALVDVGYGLRAYRYLAIKLARGERSYAIMHDLEQAGSHVPVEEKIITRRYDLTSAHPDSTLAPFEIRGPQYHDRNSEFYGADLGRIVVQEGPDDNLTRAAAVVQPDSTIYYLPNEALKADLWRRIWLIDSVYDSQNAQTVLQSADSLQSRFILVDHTIGQHLRADLHPFSDTVYNSSTVTLLQLRHP